MNKKHVLIVGAGISGMVCSILLSRGPYKVTAVEKSARTAPTIRGFKRNGLYYDTGIHEVGGIGAGDILDRYLSHLNCRMEYDYFPTAAEKLRFAYDGTEFSMSWDPCIVEKTMSEQFPEDARTISEIINDMKSAYNSMPFVNLKVPSEKLHTFNETPDVSLKEYLDAKIKNEKLKIILAARCLLHGTIPEKVSVRSHFLLFASYLSRTGSFKGGGAALANKLENEAVKSGASIITGCGVTGVKRNKSGGFSAFLQDGSIIHADSIIFSIHRSNVIDILDSELIGEKYLNYIKKLEDTLTAEVFFTRLKSELSEGTPVEYIINSPELSDIATEKTIYISKGHIGPNGKRPVTFIVPSSSSKFSTWKNSFSNKRDISYEEFKKKNYEALISGLKARYPEYSDIEYADSATPLTFRDYMNNPSGSIYGISHNAGTLLPIPRLRTKGLYLTGQGIVAQGVLGAILSGYLTSSFFIGFEKLISDLKNTVI